MRNFKRLFVFLLVLAMAASLTAAFAAAEDTGFSDVNAGAWYAGAVRYCRDNDLMSGTSATAFSPDAAMTRAMFAVVLHRAQGSPAAESAAFSDVPAGAWYSNAAAWASQKGMISGYGNGLFGAGDPVTREQAAVILWRYAGRPAPSQTAEAYVDQHSISAYALDAVAWARENGVMTGLDGNRFAPKSSLTRRPSCRHSDEWSLGGGSHACPWRPRQNAGGLFFRYWEYRSHCRPFGDGSGRGPL